MPQPVLSQTLLSLAFAFIMVLCRCGAVVMLLPGLGEEGPPGMVRVGIAGAIAVLLVPVVAPQLPPPPDDFLRLVALLCGELLAGGFLGWLARLVALSLPAAGQIISLATGMSSVLQPDANFGAQTSGIGRLFGAAAPVLILTSGLYALPLSALACRHDRNGGARGERTFRAGIAIGGAVPAHRHDLANGSGFAVAAGAAIANLFRGAARAGSRRTVAPCHAFRRPGAGMVARGGRRFHRLALTDCKLSGFRCGRVA
jgi:hypothetical protein